MSSVSRLATFGSNRANRVRVYLCGHYARDATLQTQLRVLAHRHARALRAIEHGTRYRWLFAFRDEWQDLPPPIVAYIADLQRVAEESGFIQIDDLSSLHAWVCAHRSGDGLGVASVTVTPVMQSRDCRVSVEVADIYRPDTETRTEARQRLRDRCDEEIDAELASVEHHWRRRGWHFPDTEPMLATHAQWLYWRLADRKSCTTIAKDLALDGQSVSESNVRNATSRLARALQITLPRPG